MKAILLIEDNQHILAEFIVESYNRLWPGNPFQFCIPYKNFPERFASKSIANVQFIEYSDDRSSMLSSILRSSKESDWVYWCNEEFFPVHLDIDHFKKTINWLRDLKSNKVVGVSMSRTNGWFCNVDISNEFIITSGEQLFLAGKNTPAIWFHQFIKVSRLRTLLADHSQNEDEGLFFVSKHDNLVLNNINTVKSLRNSIQPQIHQNKSSNNLSFDKSSKIKQIGKKQTKKEYKWIAKVEKKLILNRIYKPSSASLPNFIVIGAQKAGTTWLYNCLKKHPEIEMPDKKELHFFDLEKNYERRVSKYLRHFRTDKVSGDITPAYSIISEERIAFMRRLLPEAKLILIIRNPIDRAWSHAVMDLCKNQMRDIEEVKDVEFIEHFQSEASISRGDYNVIIKKYRDIFDDQLLVVDFDEISRDPINLISKILTHIGVSSSKGVINSLPLNEIIFSNNVPSPSENFKNELDSIYRDRIVRFKNTYQEFDLNW